ncbi:MAG: hypothetical protein WA629_09440, partial [Candidatus Aquilonibacter sp.]
MMTPPLSIWASPRFTVTVPVDFSSMSPSYQGKPMVTLATSLNRPQAGRSVYGGVAVGCGLGLA